MPGLEQELGARKRVEGISGWGCDTSISWTWSPSLRTPLPIFNIPIYWCVRPSMFKLLRITRRNFFFLFLDWVSALRLSPFLLYCCVPLLPYQTLSSLKSEVCIPCLCLQCLIHSKFSTTFWSGNDRMYKRIVKVTSFRASTILALTWFFVVL